MDNLLALPIGTELAGDYRIRRVLGAGGFGITYLAEETPLNRGVAIKEYFPSDFAAREGTTLVRSKSRGQEEDYKWGLERFIEEAQALATFDHANIVRVYRYFRQNNTGYMVLKLEDGRSFKSWLDGLGRRPRQEELDAITAPLLDALEMIHAGAFLHRDIAPDNIIIRPDGSPVLIDFGSARREVASHMRTMSVLVKPGYSPVEQYAQDSKRQGPWSDIYALAATLYHAVTGKRPADAPARMQTDDLIPAATVALGNYRRSFLGAIDTALALAIDKRPQSIAAWRPLLLPEPDYVGRRKPAVRAEPSGKTRKGPTGTRKLDGEVPPPIRLKPRKANPPPIPSPAAPTRRRITAVGGAAATAAKPVSMAALLAPSAAMAVVALGQARKGAADGWRWLKDALPRRVPDPEPPPKHQSLMKRLDQAKLSFEADEARPITAAIAAAPAEPAATPIPALAKTPVAPTQPPLMHTVRRAVLRLALITGFVTALATLDHWGPLVGLLVPHGPASALAGANLIRTLSGLAVAGESLTVTPDAALIAAAGSDGQIVVWDAGTGTRLRAFGAPGAGVTALTSSEHVLLAGRADGSVSLWQLDSGEKLADFDEHEGPVWGAAFLGSSRQFATVGEDAKVRLWDGARGLRMVWSEHKKPVFAIAYNARAHLIATAGADRSVKLWDERRRRLIRSYDGIVEDVRALALSPDGGLLASAGNDKTISIWSTADGGKSRSLEGHTNRVLSIAFSPDGKLLASGSEDGTVRLWDATSGALVTTYEGHVQPVRAVAFVGDGRRLASAGEDGSVRLWSVKAAAGS